MYNGKWKFVVLGTEKIISRYSAQKGFWGKIRLSLDQEGYGFDTIPTKITAIYIERKAKYLRYFLQHLRLPTIIDKKIILITITKDGRFIEKCVNEKLKKSECYYKGLRNLPSVVSFEPINVCNLKCIYCEASNEQNKLPNKYPVSKLFKLDSLKGCSVQIGGSYEPTIHANFQEFIKYFNKNGCTLGLITNGTQLTKEKIEELVNSNMYAIQVSLDAGTDNTYSKIRKNGIFSKTIENLKILNETLKKNQKETFLLINAVLMRSNIDEIEIMIDLLSRIGADLLGFNYLVVRFDDKQKLSEESLDPIIDYAQKKLDEAALYAIGKGKISLSSVHFLNTDLKQLYPENFQDGLVMPNRASRILDYENKYVRPQINNPSKIKNGCASPFQYANISSDGAVSLCQQFSVGYTYDSNLLYNRKNRLKYYIKKYLFNRRLENKELAFDKIWFGRAANFIRAFLINHPDLCEVCDHYKHCLSRSQMDLSEPSNIGCELSENVCFIDLQKTKRVKNEIESAIRVSKKLYTLFRAIYSNNIETSKALIKDYSLLEETNGNGFTPLIFSTLCNNLEMVSELLCIGADVNKKNFAGVDSGTIAISCGFTDILELLLSNGADKQSILHFGVNKNQVKIVGRMLKSFTKDEFELHSIEEHLLHAIEKGFNDVALKLISFGADLNFTNNEGLSPLMLSVIKSNYNIIDKLIAVGADVDLQDTNGSTALHYAAVLGNEDIVSTLVRSSADLEIINRWGQDPLTASLCQRRINTAKRIIKAGGNLDNARKYARRRSLEEVTTLINTIQ